MRVSGDPGLVYMMIARKITLLIQRQLHESLSNNNTNFQELKLNWYKNVD